ncbi:uncharacterized protein TNCT_470341 [Trichonephila clavata]|uniref:Uncharacterized protein n=1 Tax=Trichonephila clavata TaxID=2740835 RepID=A0A8X6F354_TRICU|nr:uncharacterized protein TNCT_470341 [Trichonephila clavata]
MKYIFSGFIELPEDSDIFETIDSADLTHVQDESFLNRFFRKLKRVRDLDLSKLKRSRTCQFYCEPAIENRDSGVGASLHDAEPLVRVMINHCLRCLRRKGFMNKIMQRRLQKREVLATPNNQKNRPNIRRDSMNVKGCEVFRKLLFKVKKEEIVVKERFDEDYTSNYEDVPDDSGGIDFEKIEEIFREVVPLILIGLILLCGIFFTLIFPIFSFLKTCCTGFRTNIIIICNVCFCCDPKYQLVKQECEKEGIYIPKYRNYQKLMKTYKAAAIARAKKKEEEENAESS